MFARGLRVCTISRPFAPLTSFQFKSWNPTRDKRNKRRQRESTRPRWTLGVARLLFLGVMALLCGVNEPVRVWTTALWLSSVMALLHGLNEPVSAVKVNPSRTRHSSIESTARLTFHMEHIPHLNLNYFTRCTLSTCRDLDATQRCSLLTWVSWP